MDVGRHDGRGPKMQIVDSPRWQELAHGAQNSGFGASSPLIRLPDRIEGLRGPVVSPPACLRRRTPSGPATTALTTTTPWPSNALCAGPLGPSSSRQVYPSTSQRRAGDRAGVLGPRTPSWPHDQPWRALSFFSIANFRFVISTWTELNFIFQGGSTNIYDLGQSAASSEACTGKLSPLYGAVASNNQTDLHEQLASLQLADDGWDALLTKLKNKVYFYTDAIKALVHKPKLCRFINC